MCPDIASVPELGRPSFGAASTVRAAPRGLAPSGLCEGCVLLMMASTLLLLGERCPLASVISGSRQSVVIRKPVLASPTTSLRPGAWGERPRAGAPLTGPALVTSVEDVPSLRFSRLPWRVPPPVQWSGLMRKVHVKMWGETGQGAPCHHTHVGAKGRVQQGTIWAVVKTERMPQLIPQGALEMRWRALFQTEIRGPGFHWIWT